MRSSRSFPKWDNRNALGTKAWLTTTSNRIAFERYQRKIDDAAVSSFCPATYVAKRYTTVSEPNAMHRSAIWPQRERL